MSTQNQPQSKNKLGLDDPRQVRKIFDRGHSFLPQRANHNRAVNGVPSNVPDQCDSIGEELESALVTCGLEQTKFFLPHNELERILPFHRVRKLLQELRCFPEASDKEILAEEICYGSRDRPPSLKLLAALICIGFQEDIFMHMRDGLNDSCFPLSFYPCNQRRHIKCKAHRERHATVNNQRLAIYRENLSTWSYRLSTPFILKKQSIHFHYILDAGDVLPILYHHDTPHDTLHTGGFSTVHKIQLHPNHFELEMNEEREVRYVSNYPQCPIDY